MAQVTTLPVFVFPNSMKFYFNKKKDRKDSLKQLMTIYNPYDFTIKYKITGTAPRKYKISNPEGYIDPKSSFDIVVEHCVPTISNCGTIDKLKINVTGTRANKIAGSYVLDVILLDSEEEHLESLADFHSIKKTSERNSTVEQGVTNSDVLAQARQGTVVFFAFVSLTILILLPLKGVDSPSDALPNYLYLSSLTKICMSFVVGLITGYYLVGPHDPS